MDANCPPQVASETTIASSSTEGLATAVLDRIGQLVCALHGHDQILQFAEGRMFLQCVSCGHESPGWDMPEHSPVPKFAGATGQTGKALIEPTRRVA